MNTGYDPITEVLTPSGWVKLPSAAGMSVALFSLSSAIEFVKPFRLVMGSAPVACRIENGSADLFCGTEQTLCIQKQQRKNVYGNPILVAARECRAHWRLPCSGIYASETPIEVTVNQARLVAAWQADGGFDKQGALTWNLKKNRKKDRLKSLLAEQSVRWREQSFPSCPGYTLFTVKRNDLKFLFDFVQDDNFGWNMLEWTPFARAEFLDELSKWDGDSTGNEGSRFFTASAQSANVASAIAAISGYSSILTSRDRKRRGYDAKTEYVLSIIKDCAWRRRSNDPEIIPYSGMLYNLATPSGFLLLRRNGKCCIGGAASQ